MSQLCTPSLDEIEAIAELEALLDMYEETETQILEILNGTGFKNERSSGKWKERLRLMNPSRLFRLSR